MVLLSMTAKLYLCFLRCHDERETQKSRVLTVYIRLISGDLRAQLRACFVGGTDCAPWQWLKRRPD